MRLAGAGSKVALLEGFRVECSACDPDPCSDHEKCDLATGECMCGMWWTGCDRATAPSES
jgi:hypothetical protein